MGCDASDPAMSLPQRLPLLPLMVLLLAGCNLPGMGPDPRVAQREAEAKAIGGACRHGLRSIEDCYNLNEDASKAAVFAGWKEMDEYMRENKIEGVRASVKPGGEEEEVLTDTRSKSSAESGKPTALKPAGTGAAAPATAPAKASAAPAKPAGRASAPAFGGEKPAKN